MVFSIQPDLPRLQAFYRVLKNRAQQFGRRSQDIRILSAVMPFVGQSRQHARELQEQTNALADPLVGLSTLSSHMNVDFSGFALDAPLGDVQVSGIQGLFKLLRAISAERQLTLADAGRLYAQGVLTPQIAGTAADVADWLQSIIAANGADGFVISPSHLPYGFDDFVDQVIPELQRRGAFRQDYAGRQLRQQLAASP